jgi:hypothetical protein
MVYFHQLLRTGGMYFFAALSIILFPSLFSDSALSAQSGVELAPLTYNEVLVEKAEEKREAMHSLSQHLRSDTEPEIITVDVSSGGQVEFCPDNPFVGELLDSLSDLSCADLSYSEITSEENCLTILADNIGSEMRSDTLCLLLSGSGGSEHELIILINIRPVRSLPFVDDFSYKGPFPHPDYWTDRDVFVNSTLGKNPVSVGLATFDGVDQSGTPYGGDFGRADHLTSAFINMNSAISGQCFLTFYIQAGGYSYVPVNTELLILEFKNENGEWEEISSYSSANHSDTESFHFKSIMVEDRFFYDDFQFRFVNLADGTGMNSNWHVNYIKLANEFQADLIFENDIAFTHEPGSILERYTAMPFRQFVGFEREELTNEIKIGLFNHFSGTRQADPSNLRITETTSGQQALSETLLEVPPVVDENQRDLAPGRHFFTNNLQNEEPFKNNVESIASGLEDKMILRMDYSFQQNEEQIPELRRNNEVSSKTVIDDYYAYDDGSAERALNIFFGSGGSSPSLAIRFRNNIGDTLRGVALNLPRISPGDRNKRFRIMVWGASLEDEPLFESENIGPIFVDVFHDSIQGFSTYALRSPETGQDTAIFIPPGDFHVGWKQISRGDNGVYVGFDSNNPGKADNLYFNDGAIWRSMNAVNPNVQGAVMIRPVFSDGPVIQTNVRDITGKPDRFNPYPNPTGNWLHFDMLEISPENQVVEVYSVDGRFFPVTVEDQRINVSQLPAGNYILIVRDKHSKQVHRGSFVKH